MVEIEHMTFCSVPFADGQCKKNRASKLAFVTCNNIPMVDGHWHQLGIPYCVVLAHICSVGIITIFGKHTEKYGRKVSGLMETMAAGLRHGVSYLCQSPMALSPLNIQISNRYPNRIGVLRAYIAWQHRDIYVIKNLNVMQNCDVEYLFGRLTQYYWLRPEPRFQLAHVSGMTQLLQPTLVKEVIVLE